jgi:dienelactone hydrolase
MLKGLLWKPSRSGRFPTIIFCHGSYGGSDTIHDAVEQCALLGPVFAKDGYNFFVLFRRGVGLSLGQGENTAVLMNNAYKEKGQEGRNIVQLRQLQSDQLDDMIAGLQVLRARKDVDTNNMAVMGHSFGGSLALLLAEHETNLKCVVVFSAAGYSWNLSPELRKRLLLAAVRIIPPVMIVHARNDYSINGGEAIDSARQGKAHLLKIYPDFGGTADKAHNFIFLGTEVWEADVLHFLHSNMKH